jgi:hypothetical protein
MTDDRGDSGRGCIVVRFRAASPHNKFVSTA